VLLDPPPPFLPPEIAAGAFTLAWEAYVANLEAEEEHPEEAPDGTSLAPTEEVNVTTCLACHAPDSLEREGEDVAASILLRDIVHPAHLSSQTFKLELGGSCFSCHNVNAEGEWELLTQAVEVNEHGVPDHDNLPIPGSIPIEY
jgi:mono/diheme cytochrome c family protein